MHANDAGKDVADKHCEGSCRWNKCCQVLCADLTNVNPSFQSEDGEKSIVYNTVGSNVCMGDHKVKVKGLL